MFKSNARLLHFILTAKNRFVTKQHKHHITCIQINPINPEAVLTKQRAAHFFVPGLAQS